MREELVERDEGEQDWAEMVCENVPTPYSDKGIKTISQQPNSLLKNPQIKGLSAEEIKTPKLYCHENRGKKQSPTIRARLSQRCRIKVNVVISMKHLLLLHGHFFE
jgi:hypothetical protein